MHLIRSKLVTSIAFDIEMDTVAWWYMSCGRALGMLNGNLIEYDSSTLAPLGLVVGADELVGKKIGVINSGLDADTCQLLFDEEGMEGADCAALAGDLREQAVVLLDKKTNQVTVVQPNEDVSSFNFYSGIADSHFFAYPTDSRSHAHLGFVLAQDCSQ